MTLLQALLIGLFQGLTEFFPVSSSAHLRILQEFLGIKTGETALVVDLACHVGTLLALLLYFRKQIYLILRYDLRQTLLYIFALAPLIPAYFLLKPFYDWMRQTQFLGYCLMVTAVILLIGQSIRLVKKKSETHWQDALWIGVMQALALIPGISRSGSTISMARCLGWPIAQAVRFSFFLSIPAILGGTFLESKKAFTSNTMAEIPLAASLIALFSAFVVGSFILPQALKILDRGNLRPFAWYCLVLGALLQITSALR